MRERVSVTVRESESVRGRERVTASVRVGESEKV